MPSMLKKRLAYAGRRAPYTVSRGSKSTEEERKEFEDEKRKRKEKMTYAIVATDLRKIKQLLRRGRKWWSAPKRAGRLADEYGERAKVTSDLAAKHRNPNLSSRSSDYSRRAEQFKRMRRDIKRKRRGAGALAGTGVTSYGVGEIDA